MEVHVVLIDLDDTLIDTRSSLQAARAATCRLAFECYPGLTEERIRQAYDTVAQEFSRQREAGRLSFATTQDTHLHRWTEVLARCGVESTHAAALADCDYTCRLKYYRLYPEVPEVLPELASSYRLALLTNGLEDLQRQKVAAFALEQWIPTAWISGEVGVRKPDPGIFWQALAHLECEPGDAVMVGDSLHHDIAGAAALGIRTIWLNRNGQPPEANVEPDAVIADLRPLPGLLSRWRVEA
jgi:HAD superfamily hydrolase (TIGR01509 family)